MRSRTKHAVHAILIASALAVLAGCGGGSGTSKQTGGGGASRESQLVRFDVDVRTGKVMVTPPADGRAVFNGSAVSFTSSDLLSVGGDAGQRKIHVSVTNNSGQTFTGTPRLVVEGLTNGVSSNYYRKATAVSTFAGALGASGNTEGVGASARFTTPASVAAATGSYAGTYFVSDSSANTLRKVTSGGGVTTLLASGTLSGPQQVAVDGSGNVFVADTGHHQIQRVSPLGVCTVVAGTAGTAGTTNGLGTVATFTSPKGVAVSEDGNRIYVADTGSNVVRCISLTGTDRTAAASYTVTTVTSAVASPVNLALTTDSYGSEVLFATQQGAGGNKVWRIANLSGTPAAAAIAGTGTAGIVDGVGSVAQFNSPRGVAVVTNEGGEPVMFVTEDHAVRVILLMPGGDPTLSSNYSVKTLAGSPSTGADEGNGMAADFATPNGLCAIPSAGASTTLLVADGGNCAIRKVTLASGLLRADAWSYESGELVRLLNWDAEVPNRTAWTKDLSASNESDLEFYVPSGVSAFTFAVSVEADTDTVNLPADKAWMLTTIAGDGKPGAANGPGKLAQFNGALAVAAVPTELQSVYGFPVRAFVADTGNHCIRAVDTSGRVTLFAGRPGVAGSADGNDDTGSTSGVRFSSPSGIAVGPDGSLYVADTDSKKVRRIAADGTVCTLVAYGSASSASPYGIAVDAGGTVFFTDKTGHKVQRLSCAGDPTLPASYACTEAADSGEGTQPSGIVCDSDGSIYVACYGDHTIRKLVRSATAGTMTTSLWAGIAGTAGDASGAGTSATFDGPSGIAVDRAHNVYVTDNHKHRIRRISPVPVVKTIFSNLAGFVDGDGSAGSKLNGPTGLAIETGGSLLIADTGNHSLRCLQRVVDTAVASK